MNADTVRLARAGSRVAPSSATTRRLDAAIGDADHGTNMDRLHRRRGEVGETDGRSRRALLTTAGGTLVDSWRRSARCGHRPAAAGRAR